MAALIGTLFATSLLDCLNPTAIAQQLLLQAALKKKSKVWFFISGMFLANLALGLAVYYGAMEPLIKGWNLLSEKSPAAALAILLCGGALSLTLGIVKFVRTAAARKKSKEEEAKLPERELTSPVLFGMGVVFTAVELTSALPYFGFLAAMASHAPHAAVVILLTALYSFVYVLPLILIYFFYRALRGTKAIAGLERAVGKISAYILPVALVVLGIILAASGVLRAL